VNLEPDKAPTQLQTDEQHAFCRPTAKIAHVGCDVAAETSLFWFLKTGLSLP